MAATLRIVLVVGMKVVWLSAGVSSFIAGYLVKETVDEWIYIDIADQHPDSLRFIKDCEKAIGKQVTILRSDEYNTVEEVVRKYRYINSPHGAPCTGMLKKKVRKQWENDHLGETLTYVWGMDLNEQNRADRLIKSQPEYKHEFPLIDRCISKQEAHAILDRLGIKRPVMYDLGFLNNNCVGCVKGGMWYWNMIRKHFPDVFEKRAKMERDIGASCLNGMYLDELPINAGRKNDEISQDCGVMCYLTLNELEDK